MALEKSFSKTALVRAPLTVMVIVAPARSSPASGRPCSASTKNAEEPLSATVSAKVIFQSAIALSTISIAGSAQSIAVRNSPQLGAAELSSRPTTKATS